jgi:hypothetical protein
MSRVEYCLSRWPALVAGAVLLLTASGCVGLTAQIMYMIKGNKIEPECTVSLENKRVAVVCLSKGSIGNGSEASALGRGVAAILRTEVKEIEMVRFTEIEDWMDTNDWDQIDYRAVGRGVNADMLIAIDLSSLSYYEGATLYKGKAHYTITLYNMEKGGKQVWQKSVPEFAFPAHGGRPATDMVETKFKQDFLKLVAQDIARCFHSYDKIEALATDAQGF